MGSGLFKDYRCSCGKLLLKGFLFHCIIEIKCKRCGTLMSWGLSERIPCVVIESDKDERVTLVSGDARAVLGCATEYVLGKQVPDIFPRIQRSVPLERTGAVGRFYEIPDNHLVLHDGQSRRMRSCVVPRSQNGAFAGYRIFSVPESAQPF